VIGSLGGSNGTGSVSGRGSVWETSKTGFEGVQQDRLADPAQPGDQHALLGPREPETREQDAEGLDLLVAAGQRRRAGAGTGRVGVADRVDSVECTDLYEV
jgi:hypothetical protein